jgi:tryptophanyl-tRNA synthetase
MLSPTTSRPLFRAASRPTTAPLRIYLYRCRYNGSSEKAKNILRKNRTIFSAIQPTGIPHLGNYLGALKPWVKLQNEARAGDRLLFSIADLHAITVRQDPDQLMQWRREMFASFLAVGLDPQKSILFAQSSVHSHSELMWVLSCFASMGYLSRMTQWKSKMSFPDGTDPLDLPKRSDSNASRLDLALFSYPVLQAADILLYNTTHVPVGEDQAQHLEFTRELAESLNRFCKKDTFMEIPETLISPAKRVMSLSDPTKKMSKSDPKLQSRILITDTREEIHAKVKIALTDSIPGVYYDPQLRPGVSNLIDIMYYMDESEFESPEFLARELQGSDTSLKALKELAADTIDKNIREVREKFNTVMAMDEEEIEQLVKEGTDKAKELATAKMVEIKESMGLSWGFVPKSS